MRNNKLKRQLQLKQKLISKGNGKPSNGEGRDGDLTVRFVQGQGMFLFYKWAGKWYGPDNDAYTTANHIEYITIASLGDGTDAGDLDAGGMDMACASGSA